MANEAKGGAARALEILRAAVDSTVVNGYVLTADQYWELVTILDAIASPADNTDEPSPSPRKPRKRG